MQRMSLTAAHCFSLSLSTAAVLAALMFAALLWRLEAGERGKCREAGGMKVHGDRVFSHCVLSYSLSLPRSCLWVFASSNRGAREREEAGKSEAAAKELARTRIKREREWQESGLSVVQSRK